MTPSSAVPTVATAQLAFTNGHDAKRQGRQGSPPARSPDPPGRDRAPKHRSQQRVVFRLERPGQAPEDIEDHI